MSGKHHMLKIDPKKLREVSEAIIATIEKEGYPELLDIYGIMEIITKQLRDYLNAKEPTHGHIDDKGEVYLERNLDK